MTGKSTAGKNHLPPGDPTPGGESLVGYLAQEYGRLQALFQTQPAPL